MLYKSDRHLNLLVTCVCRTTHSHFSIYGIWDTCNLSDNKFPQFSSLLDYEVDRRLEVYSAHQNIWWLPNTVSVNKTKASAQRGWPCVLMTQITVRRVLSRESSPLPALNEGVMNIWKEGALWSKGNEWVIRESAHILWNDAKLFTWRCLEYGRGQFLGFRLSFVYQRPQ